MAIGQPQGPAFRSARIGAAKAVLSEEESMHEYQDNGTPGVPDFATRFVSHHVNGQDFAESKNDISFLPIPGIKPMLGLVILACNSYNNPDLKVATTTNPGYPTPKVWCNYLLAGNYELPTHPENSFLFEVENIPPETDLIHINYPHNPSGAVATQEWWEKICSWCQKNGVRLFNDGAYAMLAHNPLAKTLTSVAVNYPDLSWAEAFSASKAIGNGTGWRVGAIVGSTDFISDIETVKGNTDSGLVAAMASGVIDCLDYDIASVRGMSRVYRNRIRDLTSILNEAGMQETIYPGAGFFTLWKAPEQAFGKKITSGEDFNFLMIEKTGVMGVHFGPYVRYAVVGPIDHPETREKIGFAFEKAKIGY
jgi:LL-diaminopimelate aminotransferase